MDAKKSPPDVDWICFDLDNTLYPLSNGLWQIIDARIQEFVSQTLGLPLNEAKKLQKHYWRSYGTTLAGLMAEHGIEPGPYLAYVHDFDVSPFVGPNPQLKALLAALPQRKIIFTNASARHAHNVLRALELEPFFQQIVGVEDVGYIPKPDPRAYVRCVELTGVLPERSMFIDDMLENLRPAKNMHMITVLVGKRKNVPADVVDYQIDRIEELGRIFGISFGGPEGSVRSDK